MPTTARLQQHYDHRLRNLVQRTGDVTVATDFGVPRSTAPGWLGTTPTVVIGLDVVDLTEPELRREILKLQRRVQKLTALLHRALALLRTSEFSLSGERLPEARAKMRILRAVDRAREYLPLRAVLRFLRVSPNRFHAWCRRQRACVLDDQSSCPRISPSRLTPWEVGAIKDLVTSPEYRHVPTGTLAVLAQRLGKVWASPSTWYRLVRQNGWRRPRLRVHPAKPKIGLRTTRADQMWHIDTTVIRLLDGTRAYLHAVIDNFSRRILAWRIADRFAPVNRVGVLVEASRGARRSETTPVGLADAGVENVNAQVDELITPGVLRRVLAFTELKFSSWRAMKVRMRSAAPISSTRARETSLITSSERAFPSRSPVPERLPVVRKNSSVTCKTQKSQGFSWCDYRKPGFRYSGLLMLCCGCNWRPATVTVGWCWQRPYHDSPELVRDL